MTGCRSIATICCHGSWCSRIACAAIWIVTIELGMALLGQSTPRWAATWRCLDGNATQIQWPLQRPIVCFGNGSQTLQHHGDVKAFRWIHFKATFD